MLVCGNGSVFAQDTITISVVSGGTRYYFADDGSGKITNPSNNLTSNCLWVIQKQGNTGNQYTFKNVGTSRWLRYSGNSFSLQNQGTSCILSRAFTSPSTTATLKGSTNGRYLRYNNGWKAENSGTQLTIEKWTMSPAELVATVTPVEHYFGYAEDEAVAPKQGIDVTCTLSMGKNCMVCKNDETRRIELEDSPEFDKNKLTPPSFSWRSNGTNESNESKNGTTPLISFGDVSGGGMVWKVRVQPEGPSPMDLTDNGTYKNHVDELNISYSYDGKPGSSSITIVRRAYHQVDISGFDAQISPNKYTFPKKGGATAFNVQCTYQEGYELRDADDRLEKVVYTEGPIKYAANNEEFIKFSLKEKNTDDEPSWLNISSMSTNAVVVTAEENPNTTIREARLVGTCKDDYGHSRELVCEIAQRIKDGDITFIHNQGATGAPLVVNPYTNEKEQQVHTAEKTIYYVPGEDVALILNEAAFYGYIRWYDYQTGGDPMYNQYQKANWRTRPVSNTQGKFVSINEGDGISNGLYAINMNSTDITNANVLNHETKIENSNDNAPHPNPVLIGWADGGEHIMACDVSNYTDFEITANSIKEPTLSYRQLFYMKPASQMAEKLMSLSQQGKYLEEYHYQAPTGTKIYLSTEYRYARVNHTSEYCYFYTGTNGTLERITETTGAQWYCDGNQITPSYETKDFLSVNGVDSETTKVYTLIVPQGKTGLSFDLLIAKFEVTYISKTKCGPADNGINGFSRADVQKNYNELQYFSFDDYATTHLPWDQTTYGYYFKDHASLSDRLGNNALNNQYGVPFYGEYTFVRGEHTIGSWAGYNVPAANGSALFVDGTTEPGLVASIATNEIICEGQTLYCSVWLCNPRSSNDGQTPIFRCNIQGRNENPDGTYTEWEDAGVFFIGALENRNQSWRQVVFPIVSQKQYDESRVSIYNFGVQKNGNDFLIDNLSLFVSRLPLASYQANSDCRTAHDQVTTETAAVLRLDYSEIDIESDDPCAYYQIYNETKGQVLQLSKTVQEGGIEKIVSAYYSETEKESYKSPSWGSIKIPASDYVPAEAEQYESVTALLNALPDGQTSIKGYVNDKTGKWYLYVIHMIPHAMEYDKNLPQNTYFIDNHSYVMRMAFAPSELAEAECSKTTPLQVTQETFFVLRNEQLKDDFLEIHTFPSVNHCANDIYFLDAKVRNTLANHVGGDLTPVEGLVLADWLVGLKTDWVYGNYAEQYEDIENMRAEADRIFKEEYGYTHDQVARAMMDMRDLDSGSEPNPNYYKTDFDEILPQYFDDYNETKESSDNYNIVKHLYDNGLLQLAKPTIYFYLPSEGVARYWVFPIQKTATADVNYNGEMQTITLNDCNEPKWVEIKAVYSDYTLNVAPTKQANKTDLEKITLPTIRILLAHTDEELKVPITDLNAAGLEIKNDLYESGKDDFFTLKVNDLQFVDIENGTRIDRPVFEQGMEYMAYIDYNDKNGFEYIDNNANNCKVGRLYFTLLIKYDVVVWQPKEGSNDWGDDDNWKGMIQGKEMPIGFTPIEGVKVIIPANESAIYPVLDEDQKNKYPLDVNFSHMTCSEIYFQPGTSIMNQHLLHYEKAFVDMAMPSAVTWNSMAAPLQDMYSGDFFIPHDVNVGADDNPSIELQDFEISDYQGRRNSWSQYAFWLSYHNKTVTTYRDNNTTVTMVPETNTETFRTSNSLSERLEPGMGFQVLGAGPHQDSEDNLVVRFPKHDNEYFYYNQDGTKSDISTGQLDRTNVGKMAFQPDADGNMTIILKSDVEGGSTTFMFGNPTMSHIDMVKFLITNSDDLVSEYSYMESDSWNSVAVDALADEGDNPDPEQYLAPMRSVKLTTKEPTNELTLTLSTNHLTQNPSASAALRNTVKDSAPKRMVSDDPIDVSEVQKMKIYASSEYGTARSVLVSRPDAQSSYVLNEDVLFFSSGVEAGVNSATATSPVNMYTVSEQVPMMVDVREKIDTVPLSMLVHDSYRTEKVQFSFYLSLNWDKECYFCDAVTGERYRILDGLVLEMDMPQNHEVRYFIDGPDVIDPDGGGDIWSSTEDVKTSTNQVWAYSPSQGQLVVASNDIIKEVMVYDIAGRLIGHRELEMQYNSTTFNTPTGACIVKAVLRDNTEHYISALVK